MTVTCHILAALLRCLAGTNKCSVIHNCKFLCKTLYGNNHTQHLITSDVWKYSYHNGWVQDKGLKMLGEDNVLVCIPTITHPFDLIFGSEESQCSTLLLDSLFMTIQLLVIKVWLITWSYYISTSLPIDLDCHWLHLFDSGFITELQPSPTCWILDWAIWISGSQLIHHSSDSSVLGGMSNFTLIFLVIFPVLLTTPWKLHYPTSI